MVETLRSVVVTVEIDTNKKTIRETFTDEDYPDPIAAAQRWAHDRGAGERDSDGFRRGFRAGARDQHELLTAAVRKAIEEADTIRRGRSWNSHRDAMMHLAGALGRMIRDQNPNREGAVNG